MQHRNLSLKEIQDKEYEMLCSFADICEKENIRYGICGGTLLGAVRHNGFIPWDDDVDVEMPRPDYQYFIKIAKKKLPDYYKLITPYNDKEYIHPYGKLCDTRTTLIEFPEGKKIKTHLYMDIFPIDGMPDGMVKQGCWLKSMRRRYMTFILFKIAQYKLNEKLNFCTNIAWRSISLANKVIPKNALIQMVDRNAARYNFDDSKYRSNVVSGYGEREVMPKEVWKFEKKYKFRDRLFYGLWKSDYYLTNLYGDYMTLPPVEKRVHHEMIVWNNEECR